MLWRIGGILPVREQLTWCGEAGFDGIGLHASAGSPGAWEGVDPAMAGQAERRELRDALDGFRLREVHAPFAIVLKSGSLAQALDQLKPVTAFARDIGAGVVTVHAELPSPADATGRAWEEPMAGLSADAVEKGVRIGLEIVRGFDLVHAWDLPNVGITLDVGHMYAVDDGQPLEPFGSIGALITSIAQNLVHLHMHDVATLDHIEIGTGRVDFTGLLRALHEIGYAQGMCLEMNPDRVSPDGIRRSLAWLRDKTGELALS